MVDTAHDMPVFLLIHRIRRIQQIHQLNINIGNSASSLGVILSPRRRGFAVLFLRLCGRQARNRIHLRHCLSSSASCCSHSHNPHWESAVQRIFDAVRYHDFSSAICESFFVRSSDAHSCIHKGSSAKSERTQSGKLQKIIGVT